MEVIYKPMISISVVFESTEIEMGIEFIEIIADGLRNSPQHQNIVKVFDEAVM